MKDSFGMMCIFLFSGMCFLKLAGALTLSWWAVTAPLWLPLLGGLVTIFVLASIVGIFGLINRITK